MNEMPADFYDDDFVDRTLPPAKPLAAVDVRPVTACPGGFNLVTFEALTAPLPPLDYLIDPVLPVGSLLLLTGYSSSFKSWIALDALLAVATGRQWLSMVTRKGPTTLLDAESGERESRRRIQRLIAGSESRIKGTPGLDAAFFPGCTFGDASFISRISDLAKVRSLVGLDTLHAFTPGIDENSTQIGDCLNRLQSVAKTSGCSFIVVAHEKKRGDSSLNIDRRERVRGSSSIFGAADAVISVTSMGKGKPLRVEQLKARSGVEIEPRDVRVFDRGAGTVIDVQLTKPITAQGSAYSELKAAITAALIACGPMTKNGIVTEVKKGRTVTFGAIDEMVADGALALVDGRYRPSGGLKTTYGGSQ